MVQSLPFVTKTYNAYTSLIGGALSLFSPGRATAFRFGRDMYRSYVAGELSGADKNWRPRRGSGDAQVKRAYRLVAERCRDQAQNNPQIAGGIERACANVVRDGIFPQFKFKTQKDKPDRVVNSRWRLLFNRWARYCDSTGHDSYGAMQKLGLRHMWFDGQYFIHRTWDDSLKGVVPLRLEYLEQDMLDIRVDGVQSNGNVARKGIEYDSNGRAVYFNFLEHHPGDYLPWASAGGSRRISADDIIHVWDRRRISQFSGIAWMVATVMESFKMEDFRDVTMDAARMQTRLHAFLESAMPGFNAGMIGLPAGGQTSPYAPAATGAADAPRELKANAIQAMPSGTTMNFKQPTHPGDNYEPFVKDSQRMQSTGFGQSFEAFSNNYTDSSYASARSGSLEERLSYRGQQQFLEEKQNRKVMAWFIEAAFLSGLAPVNMAGYAKNPLLYHEMAAGQMPGWGWVDPKNDADAADKLIDLVLDTYHNQSSQRGNDWDEIMDVRMDEELRLLEYEELREKRLAKKEQNNATTEN